MEEDLIKCLAPTYLGDFTLSGRELRSKGINRIGNLLVPNDNYVKFEEWVMPILDQMLEEQKTQVQGQGTQLYLEYMNQFCLYYLCLWLHVTAFLPSSFFPIVNMSSLVLSKARGSTFIL